MGDAIARDSSLADILRLSTNRFTTNTNATLLTGQVNTALTGFSPLTPGATANTNTGLDQSLSFANTGFGGTAPANTFLQSSPAATPLPADPDNIETLLEQRLRARGELQPFEGGNATATQPTLTQGSSFPITQPTLPAANGLVLPNELQLQQLFSNGATVTGQNTASVNPGLVLPNDTQLQQLLTGTSTSTSPNSIFSQPNGLSLTSTTAPDGVAAPQPTAPLTATSPLQPEALETAPPSATAPAPVTPAPAQPLQGQANPTPEPEAITNSFKINDIDGDDIELDEDGNGDMDLRGELAVRDAQTGEVKKIDDEDELEDFLHDNDLDEVVVGRMDDTGAFIATDDTIRWDDENDNGDGTLIFNQNGANDILAADEIDTETPAPVRPAPNRIATPDAPGTGVTLDEVTQTQQQILQAQAEADQTAIAEEEEATEEPATLIE